MFISKLLVMNVGKFSFSYEDPSYLEFKNFSDIIARYRYGRRREGDLKD
jgi:hypothetical protein